MGRPDLKVVKALLVRDKEGKRIVLKPFRAIFSGDFPEVCIKDGLKAGCLEPASADAGIPAEAKPEIETRTHEGLDEAALDALDAQSLLVMVLERIKSEKEQKAVSAYLSGSEDLKGLCVSFLLASFSDRDTFVSTVSEVADEAPAVAEIPEPPKNMLGK